MLRRRCLVVMSDHTVNNNRKYTLWTNHTSFWPFSKIQRNPALITSPSFLQSSTSIPRDRLDFSVQSSSEPRIVTLTHNISWKLKHLPLSWRRTNQLYDPPHLETFHSTLHDVCFLRCGVSTTLTDMNKLGVARKKLCKFLHNNDIWCVRLAISSELWMYRRCIKFVSLWIIINICMAVFSISM